jgi:hypothetical protein
VLAVAAAAGQVVRETTHFEEEFVEENFCGVDALDVSFERVIDGRVQAHPKGPNGLVYFQTHGTQTEVVTNLANGKSVRSASKVLEKDKRVTDNGDGTLAVLVLATGNAVLYGPNGKAIARNPGQVRFELVIDHGGTPNDPSDDEILEFRVVKESTGRSDDFCEAAVPALQ